MIDLECEKIMLDFLFRWNFWFCIYVFGESLYVGNIWFVFIKIVLGLILKF